jgi:hypothetical protein
MGQLSHTHQTSPKHPFLGYHKMMNEGNTRASGDLRLETFFSPFVLKTGNSVLISTLKVQNLQSRIKTELSNFP